MANFVLPTQKTPPVAISPKELIIYSKPKTGKTSALAMLDNALIIDLEEGTDYVEALKVKCSSVEEIRELCREIIKAKKPYKYIVLDTVTKLEDMVLPYAKELYRKTAMGKNFDYETVRENGKDVQKDKNSQTVLHLPNGAGYQYLREALFEVLSWIRRCADRIVLLGHLKMKSIEKNGTEVEAKDLDLTGKIKSILSADVDAIGLLYRDDNKCVLSFKTTDDVICGARPDHLKNQEIVLTEIIDGKLVHHWDKVYLD
jgi:hypothetical protein